MYHNPVVPPSGRVRARRSSSGLARPRLAPPRAESGRGVCYTGALSPDPWMQKTALSANPSFYLLSLGCPKNRVDSEVMLGSLLDEGYKLVEEAQDAEVILINSCAFLGEAKQESIDAILEHAQLKE